MTDNNVGQRTMEVEVWEAVVGVTGTFAALMLVWLKFDMVALKKDLKAHETECQQRNSYVSESLGWLKGRLGGEAPEPPKPEETKQPA